MSVAYWCVLIAALVPYAWSYVAKSSGSGRFDNRDPRGWLTRQDAPLVHRADAAQHNSFEAFPSFAASVILAQLAGVAETRITVLAVAFVGLRIAHGLLYLADRPTLRSLAWAAGFGCVVALIAQAALEAGVPPTVESLRP